MLGTTKETLLKHGQIITGFANEEYIDDAVRSYFDNLSVFLNFPADFKTQIETLFPYFDRFEKTLSLLDRRLLILILEEERIKKSLDYPLGNIRMGLHHYIPEQDIMFVVDYEWSIVDGEPQISAPYPLKIRDLADRIDSQLGIDVYEEADKLMKFGIEIKKLKQDASEHIKKEPITLANKYDQIKKLHENLKKFQLNYKRMLSEITRQKNIKDIPEFTILLNRYNKWQRNILFISDDNLLIERPPGGEKTYLQERAPDKWYETMAKHLSYVLIEFFRIKDSYKSIKICDECRNFYISKIIRPQRFCSSKCRLKWNNRKRIKSGEHKEYKRQKRKKGAKLSYYG